VVDPGSFPLWCWCSASTQPSEAGWPKAAAASRWGACLAVPFIDPRSSTPLDPHLNGSAPGDEGRAPGLPVADDRAIAHVHHLHGSDLRYGPDFDFEAAASIRPDLLAPMASRTAPGTASGYDFISAELSAYGYLRMLTARAITSPTMMREAVASTAIASLAQRPSGITSVGLNATALVNAR
jgi:hypothetical protein